MSTQPFAMATLPMSGNPTFAPDRFKPATAATFSVGSRVALTGPGPRSKPDARTEPDPDDPSRVRLTGHEGKAA